MILFWFGLQSFFPFLFCLLMKSTSYSVWSHQRFLFKQLLCRTLVLRRRNNIYIFASNAPFVLTKNLLTSQNICCKQHQCSSNQTINCQVWRTASARWTSQNESSRSRRCSYLYQILNLNPSRKPCRCLNLNILPHLTWTSWVEWPTSPTSWRWPSVWESFCCLTSISFKEEDSPGYYSTLNWVKHQIPNARINNFRVRDDGGSWLCWDGGRPWSWLSSWSKDGRGIVLMYKEHPI